MLLSHFSMLLQWMGNEAFKHQKGCKSTMKVANNSKKVSYNIKVVDARL